MPCALALLRQRQVFHNNLSTSGAMLMWLCRAIRIGIKASFYARNFGFNADHMAAAYVRCIPGEEKMQITVEYCHDGGTTRAYNLDRRQLEDVGTALIRLKANLAKSLFKKRKKKKNIPSNSNTEDTKEEDLENNLNVLIINANENKVDETVPNKVAWAEENRLRIGNTDITISVNTPAVKLLPLPSSIMAGFPVFPKFELEFADLQQCVFSWEKVGSSPKEELLGAEAGEIENERAVVPRKCFDQIYTPTTEDIGLRLKLTCVPCMNGRVGKEDFVVSEDVKPGPGICPFETRHLFTSSKTDNDKVVSYNLLADTYSDSDFARDVLFPYCPPYALDMDYRRQLLLKEITGYNADIICLQEVDRKMFENELLSSLDLLGYIGSLKVKGPQGNEGVSMFILREKFRIVSQEDISLTDMLLTDPVCSDLKTAVAKVPVLQNKLEARNNVLQIIVVESLQQQGKFLCVANTHLYFHPAAGHVRLLQGATSIRHIQAVCQSYEQQGKSIAVVFCGDFNSTPGHGIVQLMTTKCIPADYLDWNDGGAEEKIEGLELRHNLDLMSACGFIDYTNYTPNFHGMLDYIFVDCKHLTVKQVVPVPSHEEVTLYSGLPSVVFPSDHIAQICDLMWID